MDLNGRVIIRYLRDASIIDIAKSVEGLGADSFRDCGSLRWIFFGSNSKICSIEARAFAGCVLLQSICIPSAVTRISERCFWLCESLQTVSFASDSQLTVIAQAAFIESGLKSLTIPSTVEILGLECFAACLKLVTVIFAVDSRLAVIEGEAFQGCSSLAPICLPSSVERVGQRCFHECNSMSRLTFSSPSNLRELLDLPRCLTGLVTIPDSVEDLEFASTSRGGPRCALCFGRDSKLKRIGPWVKRSFLHVSSRTLKDFRSRAEFGREGVRKITGQIWLKRL
jgi:hypothetical protein